MCKRTLSLSNAPLPLPLHGFSPTSNTLLFVLSKEVPVCLPFSYYFCFITFSSQGHKFLVKLLFLVPHTTTTFCGKQSYTFEQKKILFSRSFYGQHIINKLHFCLGLRFDFIFMYLIIVGCNHSCKVLILVQFSFWR